jgi:uncharacterized protein YggT (Ycf19 family)
MNHPLKFITLPNPLHHYGLTFALLISSIVSFAINSNPYLQDEGTLPVEVYWEQMELSLSMVDSLIGDDPQHVESALEKLALQWEKVTTVLMPDGNSIHVDHSFLIQQFRQKPPNLSNIHDFLTQLIQTAPIWPSEKNLLSDITPLQRILEQPEFDWSPEEPSPIQQWFAEIQRKILEFILNLLPEGLGANFSGSLLNWGLIAISVIILLLALFFMGRSLFSSFVREAEIQRDDHSQHETMTAEKARMQAEVLSQEGNYRAAVRFLYLSALLSIAERGIIRFDASKTNREVLQSVGHHSELINPLRDVIDVFDRVWYGYQPIKPEHYANYAARVDELKRLEA